MFLYILSFPMFYVTHVQIHVLIPLHISLELWIRMYKFASHEYRGTWNYVLTILPLIPGLLAVTGADSDTLNMRNDFTLL
jgi:hypothetical protein